MTRPDLLSALSAEFGKPEWQSGEKNEQTNELASKGVSDAFDTPVDVTGELRPRGADENCAYMGGTMNVKGAGVEYPINLGGCITSAGSKVVTVFAYDDPGKSGGVAGLMQRARAIAMSIAPAR